MVNDIINIKWKGISVFPENDGYQLVLLCETMEQANKLLTIMIDNEFVFQHGESEGNTELLILEFLDLKCRVSISLPPNQPIFRHFDGGLINRVTTGMDMGEAGIACNEVEIEIRDQNFGRMN